MSKKEESGIREDIANSIRKRGGWAIVTSGSIKTADGTPDIIATVPDPTCAGSFYLCAIEVKTEDGEASKLQEAIMKRMEQRGFKGFFPRSLSDFDSQFHDFVYRDFGVVNG